MPSSTRRRSPPSAALADAREQQRALERQAQEAQFAAALARGAPRRAAARDRDRGAAGRGQPRRPTPQLAEELAQLTDAAGAGRAAGGAGAAARARARARRAAQRLRRPDRSSCAAPTSARLGHEHALQPLRDTHQRKLQLEEQAAQLGGAQYLEQLTRPSADLEALGAEHRGGQRQARRACRARSTALNREIAALGAVNLAALEELGQARERKTFLDAQTADLTEAIDDARRRDPQDRPRDARPAAARPSTRSTSTSAACSRALFGGGNAQARDDRRRDPRRRRAGDGAAAGQEEQHHPPAVGRREGADRDRAGVRDLPAQPGAVLPARRGRRAARRRQHRALLPSSSPRCRKARSSSSSATTRSRWRWPSS